MSSERESSPAAIAIEAAAGTDAPSGLTAAEASARLAIEGPNLLPVPPPSPAWRLLAAEMVHFFAWLFWVAGALAFVAGLPQLGVAVFVVVVLNGLFAFVQERRAEHAAERLRDLLPRRATVVRDGRPVEINADELVAGDAVVLREGDWVSADLRLDAVHGLAVDTSNLTGESVPGHPETGDAVHAGSFVVVASAAASPCTRSSHDRSSAGSRPKGCCVRSTVTVLPRRSRAASTRRSPPSGSWAPGCTKPDRPGGAGRDAQP
jgi:hypothetical protein